MKIKKLDIIGFKSFVDRTSLRFDHDVTGIVGPNGCGKSNIVDAIKWVMGEQSASRLRGKAMDDVIFNGSESRGPAGFAEVTITFDNEDGLTPPEYRDYAEISVTRRLDRSGRSDYFINRTPVRLMDVTNLFLGTGVGRRAYSIIEQGRIGFIVSSKPEDRRGMIEEAAGITKFKVRKRAAERKMESTRQNLLRVNDILGELEKNLASLKRQAQKAERYKRYRSELKDLELWISAFRFLELQGEIGVVRRELDGKSAVEEGQRLGLRVRETEIETQRARVNLLLRQVEEAQQKSFELDNQTRVLEGQIQQRKDRIVHLQDAEGRAEQELSELSRQVEELSKERADIALALEDLEAAEAKAAERLSLANQELERRRLTVAEAERAVNNARGRSGDAEKRIARAEAVLAGFERRRQEARDRLTRVRGEKTELENRAQALMGEASELDARLLGMRSGKAKGAEDKARIQTELKALREQIKAKDKELDELRTIHAKKSSRLESLRELQSKFEGSGAGVRAIMTRFAGTAEERRSKGLIGLVADRFECDEEHAAAFAGALGDTLQDLVVQSEEAGLDALSFLRNREAGRATLYLQRPLNSEAFERVETHDSSQVVGWLMDLVRFGENDAELAELLLGDVLVVTSLEAALMMRQRGFSATLVTLQGERLDENGALTGGTEDESAGHLIAMKREMRELEDEVTELATKLEKAREAHGQLRTGIAKRQAEIDSATAEAHGAEIAIVKVEKDLRRVKGEAEQATRQSEKRTEEITTLEAALTLADDEESEARTEIEAAQKARREAEEELSAAMVIYTERKSAVEEQAAQMTEVRVEAAKARERAESDRNAVSRLDRSVSELDARTLRLTRQVSEGAAEQGRTMAALYENRESLFAAIGDSQNARERLSQVRAEHDAAHVTLGEHEVEVRKLRQTIDVLSGQVGELSLRDRELSLALEHLFESTAERHRVDLRDVLIDYHARALPEPADRQRAKELVRLIERMGEINLMAIEEYEEKSERFTTLSAQRDDLESALTTLERAIREMNRESRRLFKEAFVAVNERFKRLFPVLFRGGKAELKLSEPNNVLESGIEIVAQPPGKKLGRLELMSGGEKALTAVAMIFAIFQYKPSPFCLLDEVDAPLDEANISRFAEAIRQMTERSQFIVITHSKRTMEYTDVLYGVTMEQPGISKTVSVELRGEKRPVPGRDVAVA